MSRLGIFGIVIGVLLFIGLIYTSSCITHIDNTEVGYYFNSMTGEKKALLRNDKSGKPYITESDTIYLHQGYTFVFAPFESVNTVDLRPIQLCISAKSGQFDRVLNCKLVSFNPVGVERFMDWHGRQNYTSYELEVILKAYAYDENYDENRNEYSFLTIRKEQ